MAYRIDCEGCESRLFIPFTIKSLLPWPNQPLVNVVNASPLKRYMILFHASFIILMFR